MRSTRVLAPALVLLAAMACSSISTTTKSKPAPAPAPAPAQKQGKSTAATLGIPPGHLPPPGQCRVWMPGTPPGHQAKARSCANIERSAPAGARLPQMVRFSRPSRGARKSSQLRNNLQNPHAGSPSCRRRGQGDQDNAIDDCR